MRRYKNSTSNQHIYQSVNKYQQKSAVKVYPRTCSKSIIKQKPEMSPKVAVIC